MSFILDALKKSENERQRTIGPSLADAPARAPQSDRPWWAVAVAGLLVGNIAVLLFVLLRDDKPAESPTPVTAPARETYVAPPPQPAQRVQPAPMPADPSVRSLAEEAGATDPAYDESGFAGEPDVYENAPPPVASPAAAPPQPRAREVLPEASALIASGTALPDMKLDIHVYSNDPAQRFIFVNMRKYTEGQTLSEGPALERITPDGAVLNYQGLRFILPRQ